MNRGRILLNLIKRPYLVVQSGKKLNELLGQINPEQAREEFRSASKSNGGSGVKDFMDGMGLGLIADQVNLVCFQKFVPSFHYM